MKDYTINETKEIWNKYFNKISDKKIEGLCCVGVSCSNKKLKRLLEKVGIYYVLLNK